MWLNAAHDFVASGVASDKFGEGKADAAFMFLGFLTTVALIGMGFMWQRGGGLK